MDVLPYYCESTYSRTLWCHSTKYTYTYDFESSQLFLLFGACVLSSSRCFAVLKRAGIFVSLEGTTMYHRFMRIMERFVYIGLYTTPSRILTFRVGYPYQAETETACWESRKPWLLSYLLRIWGWWLCRRRLNVTVLSNKFFFNNVPSTKESNKKSEMLFCCSKPRIRINL